MRFCRRYRCCSSLRQGKSAHSSLGCASGALVCSILLTLLHSTRSDLRQPILGVLPSIRFSDHPTRQMHAVGTCSCPRPSMRVVCWLLRSDSSFCVACRLLLSAGFDGSEYRSSGNMSAPILVHFGPSPALACGYLRSLALACWQLRRFTYRFACASHSNLLEVIAPSSLEFSLISSRFSD
jgi:hypothetical protein